MFGCFAAGGSLASGLKCPGRSGRSALFIVVVDRFLLSASPEKVDVSTATCAYDQGQLAIVYHSIRSDGATQVVPSAGILSRTAVLQAVALCSRARRIFSRYLHAVFAIVPLANTTTSHLQSDFIGKRPSISSYYLVSFRSCFSLPMFVSQSCRVRRETFRGLDDEARRTILKSPLMRLLDC